MRWWIHFRNGVAEHVMYFACRFGGGSGSNRDAGRQCAESDAVCAWNGPCSRGFVHQDSRRLWLHHTLGPQATVVHLGTWRYLPVIATTAKTVPSYLCNDELVSMTANEVMFVGLSWSCLVLVFRCSQTWDLFQIYCTDSFYFLDLFIH